MRLRSAADMTCVVLTHDRSFAVAGPRVWNSTVSATDSSDDNWKHFRSASSCFTDHDASWLSAYLRLRNNLTYFILWQSHRAADTSTNWRQSLFCCCTASMEQAVVRAETAAIDGLVSSWSENISVSFCLRAPGYGLTLWCALGLLVGGAIQVPQ